jgi:squalene-hopene/tetraprenyl-beta-curcumene cyclase
MRIVYGSAMCVLAGFLVSCSHRDAPISADWSPTAAAAYLDRRETWWMGWQRAARDHETFCVSCHTSMPYALSRAALRGVLADETPSVNEQKLLENVTKRVRLWEQIGPYYGNSQHGDQKAPESRGTEAVLNALILAVYDARQGRLSEDTRTAFEHMWALQQTKGDRKGAWWWLQFSLSPWEAKDSPYYGAALAAVAAGTAPENYRSTAEIQDNLERLQEYLTREYATQSLLNRTVLLWASAKWPRLLEPERQASLISEILSRQRSDGGWSLSSLNRTWRGSSLGSYARSWMRSDHTLVDVKSDGYATGLVVFVLQQVGTPHDDVRLQRGLSWLVQNQSKSEGLWPSSSLNERRNPSSDVGHFMSDAATAYAVLALTQGNRH